MCEIEKFSPCIDSIEFRKQYATFEEAWNNCQRGDWMLWIAKKLNVDLLKLTTAKALCANTVRHLMKDDRSIKAIDVAILFGQGKSSREELDDADAAAYAAAAYADADATYAAAYAADADAADAAAYADADATYAAAYAADADATYAAAYAAAAAAYAAAYAADADATYAAAYAADADATYAAAKKGNQLQTANICREILTEVVFEAINKL